ncbi:MAG: Cell division protein FtsZ (EC [uncultured Campylobacterales bacterium]|uniref:Cell division protein FtsZ n=1 Tax=uncultured Campylobacterales bacterium TaxID=352960 RepID=A0A6S6T9Z3_9BACT|nr:MAG: Cell division protein FtsZ (EC [uncultured Campylobacterales bacterium]
MNEFIIEEQKHTLGAKIKVIGVGGGGGNMINHMVHKNITLIDLVAANTDAQALESSLAPIKIQIGEKKTKGLGAGMKPDIGREAAIENYEEIKSGLEGADIVFIAAGFGGGTGTGAAPIIAEASKEIGALTVSVVTKPFGFEGPKRSKLAQVGLDKLTKESDSIIIIPNDKLLSIVDKNLGIKDSFKIVDDVLMQAVLGMSEVVLKHGQGDINVDFADVRTVMSHRGKALLGVGTSTGENASINAIKSAIASPLLENMDIKGALGVLVHFYVHPDCPLVDISNAMNLIYENAHEDADVIFGTTTDATISNDEVKVTLVATGFEDQSMFAKQKNSDINLINKEAIQTTLKNTDIDDKSLLDIPSFMRKED